MASVDARRLFLLAFVLAGSAEASAQIGQPLPGFPDEDIVAGSHPFPMLDRERAALEPTGHRLGSIMVLPQIDVAPKYNSNLFATANNPKADVATVISPSLAVRSDWSRHAINLSVSGDIGRYRKYTSENFDDYGVSAGARLDIHRDSQIWFGATQSQLHEARGSPDDVNGAEPTVFDQTSGSIAYQHRFNRLRMRLSGGWVRYDFRDTAAATGTINNDDRDRNEYAASLRFGYAVTPNFEPYVRGTANLRDYVQEHDDAGFDRDSWGYETMGGMVVDLGGITKLDAFAGFLFQDYHDPRLETVAGPTFGGAINWNPARPLWLRLYAKRFVAETTQVDYSASLNTEVGIVIAMTPRPDLSLTIRTAHLVSDYERNPSSAVAEREDDFLIADIGLRYFLNRHLHVGPTARYVRRDSTLQHLDYSQTVALFRLGVRY